MKKYYICSLFCFAVFSAFGNNEWHVTDQPTQKNVLIEEFTGIHCGYCPQAHKIVNNMTTARPEAVNVISIHAGGFAEPIPGLEPDFRTDDGNFIHNSFDINSYPSGMVNRKVYSPEENDTPVTSRAYWTEMAREEVKTTAPVNIWTKAVYEGSERILTVELEGYLFNDLSLYPDLRINVALTQNNIQGPQNGTTEGDKYSHQHVLRDYLTNPLGDLVSESFDGHRFRAQYSCELPQDVNNVNIDPRELTVVAFITDGEQGEVLNSISQIPEYENYEPRASYIISDYKIPIDATSYVYDFVDLYFRNLSANIVTDLCFEISSGKNKIITELTDLEILPMHKNQLRVPCGGIIDLGGSNIKVNLTQVNGKSTNVTPLEFSTDPISKMPNKLKVVIRTDNFADDNIWAVRNSKGEDVISFGPFDNGVVNDFSSTIELEDGQIYCLEVEDSWGDGVLEPRGMIKIYDFNDNLLASNLQIQTHGDRIFFLTDESLGINDMEIEFNQTSISEYFTIDGRSLGSVTPSGYRGIVVKKTGSNAVLLKQ